MSIRRFLAAALAAVTLSACGCAEEYGIALPSEQTSAPESIAERNLSLARAPLTVPSEAVRLYISADGDEQKIQTTLRQIAELSDSVCAGLTDDLDKLYALSAYVSANYYYDNDAKAEGVTDETVCLAHTLETRRSVCMGYANLFAALCQAQGIECYVVHGGAVVSGTFDTNDDIRLHEWNAAIIGGEVIWVDALWNTTNDYTDGEYCEGAVTDRYFDPDNGELAKNHRADRVEWRDYFALLSD